MVGLYAGSFNPFHKGHYDILGKAMDIFDEVIVGVGVNSQKDCKGQNIIIANELRLKLPNNIVMPYRTLLTDFITLLEKEYGSVVLVRGLRNATDLAYEQNLYSFLKDIKPDIRIVSLFCDVEYLHYSSSGIKSLPVELQQKYLI
jgi:pantetheine-phosphate adenylyltransferase